METLESHKVKWQVSLSNGETFFEGKGNYVEYAGELSPWGRLQEYLKANDLKITSLSLYTDDGQTFNLPSLGKNPKFSAFMQEWKPFKFVMERHVARDQGDAEYTDWFTTIVAYYLIEIKDHKHDGEQEVPDNLNLVIKLSLWVDEHNTKNCWSLVTFEVMEEK